MGWLVVSYNNSYEIIHRIGMDFPQIKEAIPYMMMCTSVYYVERAI